MRPFNNLENTIPSDTYWKVQLVFIKVHAHTSLDSPLEYNQDQTPWRVKVDYGTLQQFVRYWNVIPEASRVDFFENIKKNNFCLSGAEGNTSGLLNGGGIADLPLRTLLAICQKLRKASFWETLLFH